jgi:hypothetical protein
LSQRRRPAFGCPDPFADRPRRVVSNVLVVATLELGNPVAFKIESKTSDSPTRRCVMSLHAGHEGDQFPAS